MRVLFYRERDRWIANCLEFDLIGDGETQESALECLGESIRLQVAASIENNNPKNLFHPAEGHFFKMFAEGKNVSIGNLSILGDLSIRIDNVDLWDLAAREYVAA